MGLRFNKSKKLPGGFRANVSKHGVGGSWGTKGMRITRTSTGKTRITTRIPGAGISYTKTIGGKKGRNVSKKTSGGGNVILRALYWLVIGWWFNPCRWAVRQFRSKGNLVGGIVVLVLYALILIYIIVVAAMPQETVDRMESAYGLNESSVAAESSVPEEPAPAASTESEPSEIAAAVPESSEESPELAVPEYELTFVSVPTSVSRNNDAYVQVKGAPNTEYSITVTYKSGYADADGLETKTSDADGYVSWSWHIGGKTSLNYNPSVTVSGDGQHIEAEFEVTE